MGEAVVADPALALAALVEAVPESGRDAPPQREGPMEPPESDPISGTEAMAALAGAFPDDGIVVLEAPSCTLALRNQLRISRPGSYYFAAAAGSGSASRPRSGYSWLSPSGRSSASSARGPPSTRSRRSGRLPPTRSPSRSSCSATPSTRSSMVLPGRGGRGSARARPSGPRRGRGRGRLRRRLPAGRGRRGAARGVRGADRHRSSERRRGRRRARDVARVGRRRLRDAAAAPG